MVARKDHASVLYHQQALSRRYSYLKDCRVERRLLVLSPDDHPMLSAARQQPQPEGRGFLSILESLTNLCDPFRCVPEKESHRVNGPKVYPVETFSDYGTLSGPGLIKKRRNHMRHKLFRPVSNDEES